MDSIHTYYDVLMVSRNASQEVIRAAFKSLCQKYHPDRNTHPNAERMMQQFNEAYSVLSNPIERRKYDKQLSDYEQKINQTHSERSYGSFGNESTTGTPEHKNNTVVINIPDSLSISGLKAYMRALSSKIKPLLIRAFKIIFYIVIAVILFNLFLTYIESSNTYNAAEDLYDAQQEIQDAAQELNEAAADGYYDSAEYSYSSDTPEYSLNSDVPVNEVYTSTDDSYSYKIYAPNGEPFPSSASYVAGYPQLNNNGASILTIDNSQNNEAIFGKLYYLDEVEDSPVRHFYIQGGGRFNLRNISPGNYDVRYKSLENGSISKSEQILIEEYEEYDGIRFSQITMTLYKVSNGNMETYSIPESEF